MDGAFSSPSPIIGRSAETQELETLLRERALVTLWGPAGMGKSRLAMHLANRSHALGAPTVFAELANVTDGEGLASVLAHALGMGPPRGARSRERSWDHLANGLAKNPPLLFVLDNVEQIAEPAAALLTHLTKVVTPTRFLVTSRERLRIASEHTYELFPLGLPEAERDPLLAEAVQLFVERARAAGGIVPSDAKHAIDLAKIVTELEGIPLAIELAAGRLGVLGIEGLSARLARRLDVLGRGRRDMPPRQASLRGAVAWSWDLLAESGRAVLAGVSVFRGSFDLEAARAVVNRPDDQVVDSLSELRDKSLVRAHLDPGRFALYESVRAFADESLSSESRTLLSERHLRHFLERAKDHRRPEADLENFAVATRSALGQRLAAEALELCLAIDEIVSRRGPLGYHLSLLDQALEAADREPLERPDLHAACLLARGQVHAFAGRSVDAAKDFDRASAIAKASTDRRLASDVQMKRGMFLHRERRLVEAAESYTNAAEILFAIGDDVGQGRALGNLGAVAHDKGDLSLAAERYREAIGLLRRAGERRIAAVLEGNWGLLEQERGELDTARIRFERAVEELEGEDDRRLLAIAVGNLGALEHEERNLDAAFETGARALTLLRGLGDKRSEAIAGSRLGAVLADRGHANEAQKTFDGARTLLVDTDDDLAHSILEVHEAFVDLARARDAFATKKDGQGHEYLGRVRDRVAIALSSEDQKPPAFETSDDVRVAVRILERELVKVAVSGSPEGAALIIEREGRWFRVGASDPEWLDKRRAPRLILLALTRRREEAPGIGLSLEDLFSAGWPGERVLPEARENRVNVALAHLRKGALRPHLERHDAGYFLDPRLPILWSDRDP